ncbi:MAG: AAA family ATPase, partial [Pseudomonadota bacterium]
GQPDAGAALAAVAHVLRAGVATPGRPVGSLLFLGPTGVGKTEAAKALTEVLFGDPSGLVRFDMNEYVDHGAAARLVGDAWRPDGQLTSRVRHQPFCVLLLDEIEKAHPSVHDLLLQLLDEGRLTDALGRVTDFCRAVVILTSNVGAREAAQRVGFEPDPEAERAAYLAALGEAFRPELINRLDRVVVFQALGPEEIAAIAHLQLARLLTREGFRRRTTLLRVSAQALGWIAARGFDQRMGARALKRSLERTLVGPISAELLAWPLDEAVLLDLDLCDGALRSTLHPLPWATRRAGPPGREEQRAPPSADNLRDTLRACGDSLREGGGLPSAHASAEGSSVPWELRLSTHLMELREHLDEVAPEGDPRDHLPPVSRQEARGALRMRPSLARYSSFRPSDTAAYHRMRDYLLDLMERAEPARVHPQHLDGLVEEVALGELQVHALRQGRARACALHLRLLGAGSAQVWHQARELIQAWSDLAGRAGGAADLREITTAGRLGPPRGGAASAARVMVFEGLGLPELLSAEIGVHLVFPEGGSPFGLQARLAPLSSPAQDLGPLLEAWATPQPGTEAERTVVRILTAPDAVSPSTLIQDLRSGILLRGELTGEVLLGWCLRARRTGGDPGVTP